MRMLVLLLRTKNSCLFHCGLVGRKAQFLKEDKVSSETVSSRLIQECFSEEWVNKSDKSLAGVVLFFLILICQPVLSTVSLCIQNTNIQRNPFDACVCMYLICLSWLPPMMTLIAQD